MTLRSSLILRIRYLNCTISEVFWYHIFAMLRLTDIYKLTVYTCDSMYSLKKVGVLISTYLEDVNKMF